MHDPVCRELVGQGATYEEASDVYGGAKMRSEGTRTRHRAWYARRRLLCLRRRSASRGAKRLARSA